MKKQIKGIIIGIIIGIFIFPTVVLGGTFISSLIQGKTAEEAIQILATQIDSLIGRVGNLEACRESDRLLYLLPPHEPDPATGKYFGRLMGSNNIIDLYNQTIKAMNEDGQNFNPGGIGTPILEPIIEEYYQNYLLAKERCK